MLSIRNQFWINLITVGAIIIVGGLLYTLTLRGVVGNPKPADFKSNLDLPTMPFELSPERGRFTHVLALAETGQYALNQALADVAYPDVGVHNGKYYSFFAPGVSFLVLPMYLLGARWELGQVFSFGFVALLAIVNLLMVFLIARQIFALPRWAGLFAALTFGFGSIAWSYAITLYQHHFTTLFLLTGVYAVWRYRRGGHWSWLFIPWANYGLGIAVDYPNALLLLPLMLYLASSALQITKDGHKFKLSLRLAGLATSIAFIVITGLHLWHNQANFGSWRQLSGGLPSYRYQIEPTQPSNAVVEPTQTKNVVGFFHEQNIFQGFAVLTVSKDRGLLLYAPVFILALIGIAWSIHYRRSPELWVALGCIGMNFLLYASWGDPWGGWAFGPRYLIPILPFLAIFVSTGLVNVRYAVAFRVVAFFLFAYSSAVSLLGAITTNAIPTYAEAIGLKSSYNYLHALKYLRLNESGSFAYKVFFSDNLTLIQYGAVLYLSILIIAFVCLFILPRYAQND